MQTNNFISSPSIVSGYSRWQAQRHRCCGNDQENTENEGHPRLLVLVFPFPSLQPHTGCTTTSPRLGLRSHPQIAQLSPAERRGMPGKGRDTARSIPAAEPAVSRLGSRHCSPPAPPMTSTPLARSRQAAPSLS